MSGGHNGCVYIWACGSTKDNGLGSLKNIHQVTGTSPGESYQTTMSVCLERVKTLSLGIKIH